MVERRPSCGTPPTERTRARISARGRALMRSLDSVIPLFVSLARLVIKAHADSYHSWTTPRHAPGNLRIGTRYSSSMLRKSNDTARDDHRVSGMSPPLPQSHQLTHPIAILAGGSDTHASDASPCSRTRIIADPQGRTSQTTEAGVKPDSTRAGELPFCLSLGGPALWHCVRRWYRLGRWRSEHPRTCRVTRRSVKTRGISPEREGSVRGEGVLYSRQDIRTISHLFMNHEYCTSIVMSHPCLLRLTRQTMDVMEQSRRRRHLGRSFDNGGSDEIPFNGLYRRQLCARDRSCCNITHSSFTVATGNPCLP